MKGFLGETKEERIKVINFGGNQTVNQNACRMRSEGGTKAICFVHGNMRIV